MGPQNAMPFWPSIYSLTFAIGYCGERKYTNLSLKACMQLNLPIALSILYTFGEENQVLLKDQFCFSSTYF